MLHNISASISMSRRNKNRTLEKGLTNCFILGSITNDSLHVHTYSYPIMFFRMYMYMRVVSKYKSDIQIKITANNEIRRRTRHRQTYSLKSPRYLRLFEKKWNGFYLWWTFIKYLQDEIFISVDPSSNFIGANTYLLLARLHQFH